MSKIVLGMSGGVDSSVAALILKEKGYDVIGITLKVWLGDCSEIGENACCGPKAVEDARRVADQLRIPFYVIDIKDEFKRNVIDYFCNEYSHARTPNPCVVCNQTIKFRDLFKFAKDLDVDLVATGHYARIERNEEDWQLKKAKDLTKDQSYFLYLLEQEQLRKIIFPLGDIKKSEVRKMAKTAGLHIHDKSDSQEICFVPNNNYVNFLKTIKTVEFKEGLIKDRSGKTIGKHAGIQNFTIGQRKGLGVAIGKPMYVVGLDVKSNTVFLGEEKDLLKSEFETNQTHWIVNGEKNDFFECEVKIRSTHEGAKAMVKNCQGQKAKVQLLKPEKAVTPGQAAVFYNKDQVLGGGFIE